MQHESSLCEFCLQLHVSSKYDSVIHERFARGGEESLSLPRIKPGRSEANHFTG